MTVFFLSSLTRISDLDTASFETRSLQREDWASGDYVVGEVSGAPSFSYQVELTSGRMVKVMPGDHIVGAFGSRSATLECVGSWRDINEGRMHAMTSAGLFGAVSSISQLIPPAVPLTYRGHVWRNDNKVCMADFALDEPYSSFDTPTVLLVGTSMSAGKTTTGRLIVHELSNLGLKVVGAKLTGAGRYRDILSFRDAGADQVFDFVDVGLPSTVVSEDEFRSAIRPLIHRIGRNNQDVLVAEAGASPLEPYNGAAAIDELRDHIRCTVLCASDPYSVVGVKQAFDLDPDLVTGPATSTTAAMALVERLTNVETINVMDPDSLPALRQVLERTLGVRFPKMN